MTNYIIQENKLSAVIEEVISGVSDIAGDLHDAISALEDVAENVDIEEIESRIKDVVYQLKEVIDRIE